MLKDRNNMNDTIEETLSTCHYVYINVCSRMHHNYSLYLHLLIKPYESK